MPKPKFLTQFLYMFYIVFDYQYINKNTSHKIHTTIINKLNFKKKYIFFLKKNFIITVVEKFIYL